MMVMGGGRVVWDLMDGVHRDAACGDTHLNE